MHPISVLSSQQQITKVDERGRGGERETELSHERETSPRRKSGSVVVNAAWLWHMASLPRAASVSS